MTLSPQAFRSVASIHRAGLAAAKPAAATVLVGTLYFSTDTGDLERSDGTTWAAYSGAGGGQAPSVTAGQLLGRGSDSGDGPAQEINPGEYISMTGTEVDVAGAGATSFIVQSLAAARAEVAGLGKAPADYLPNAQEMALLPSGYVTNMTGTGVLGATPTIPAAALPATIAYTDRANVFTQDQTIQNPAPILTFIDSSQPADVRFFRIYNNAQVFSIDAWNDAVTSQSGYVNVTRAGDVMAKRWVYEQERPLPMGHWQDMPYSPALFTTAGGAAWTVPAGSYFYRYALIGKTLQVQFAFAPTSVGASASYFLQVQLPPGLTFAASGVNRPLAAVPYALNAGVPVSGIYIQEVTASVWGIALGAGWTAATASTSVYGSFTAEIA